MAHHRVACRGRDAGRCLRSFWTQWSTCTPWGLSIATSRWVSVAMATEDGGGGSGLSVCPSVPLAARCVWLVGWLAVSCLLSLSVNLCAASPGLHVFALSVFAPSIWSASRVARVNMGSVERVARGWTHPKTVISPSGSRKTSWCRARRRTRASSSPTLASPALSATKRL